MQRALRIGSIAEITLELHVSWLVALALAIVSLAGVVGGWIAAAVTSLAFFAGLLAHELAHALVARRLGIRVRTITLFVFGGVAQLDEEPSRPRDEVLIAIAGPIASVLIAAATWAAAHVAPPVVAVPLAWLAKVNLALAIFNCLPGFPLDGGRIARAAIWALRGDRNEATIGASGIGRVIAWSLVGLGGWGFVSGAAPGGAWMALVGWFLLRASQASAADATIRRAIGDTTAADAMRIDFPGVHPGLDVATYVEGVVFPTGERAHVVRSAHGPIGVVTYGAALSVPRRLWPRTRVTDILTPIEALPAVAPGAMLRDVLMLAGSSPAVRVVDPGGLVGLVDRERVIALLETPPAPSAWRVRLATAAAVVLVLGTACSRSETPRIDAARARPPAIVAAPREEPTSQTELECATLRDVAVSDVVRISGDRVFYAEESRGLTVVDLRGEGAPRLAGASAFVGTPLALYVEGGVAWVVFVDWNVPIRTVLRAVDATTLAPLGERSLPGIARDVQLVGDVLYVLRDQDTRSAISSFLVKRGAIVPVDELALDGRPARLAASAAGLAAVTQADAPAVTWIDLPLDRRGALEPLGTARLSGGFPTWERGAGNTIDADEDRRVRIVRCATLACGPDDAATLEVLDFAKGPKRGASLEIAARGGVPVTRFWGERLYVAEPRGARTELRVVRTDGAPRFAGRVSVPGAITAMAAREDRVIAVGPTRAPGVRVAMHDVDIRDPAHPRLAGSASFGSDWTWSPAEDDERAISFEPNASLLALPFTASAADGRYEMGAQVVELDAHGPRIAQTYASPGWIDRVVFDGDRVVAIGRDGVHVIDAYTGERRGLEIR